MITDIYKQIYQFITIFYQPLMVSQSKEIARLNKCVNNMQCFFLQKIPINIIKNMSSKDFLDYSGLKVVISIIIFDTIANVGVNQRLTGACTTDKVLNYKVFVYYPNYHLCTKFGISEKKISSNFPIGGCNFFSSSAGHL